MKSLSSFALIAIVFITSCTKSSSTPKDNTNSKNATVVAGNYIITKFTDSNPNEDNTINFSGYVFTFSPDGKITAIKNGVSIQGSYTQTLSHEGEGARLTISFSQSPLNELNKKWQIDNASDAAINLSDDDNASEVLVFTAQ